MAPRQALEDYPLPAEVVRLRDKAEEHKRNEGRQRRAARRTMAELEEVCQLLGINFREVKRDKGHEGQSHKDSSV